MTGSRRAGRRRWTCSSPTAATCGPRAWSTSWTPTTMTPGWWPDGGHGLGPLGGPGHGLDPARSVAVVRVELAAVVLVLPEPMVGAGGGRGGPDVRRGPGAGRVPG